VKLASHAFTKYACKRDALLHRRPFERNERDDIRRPHPRMLPRVSREVDQIPRLRDPGECRVDRGVSRGDERDHRAIVRDVCRDIEHGCSIAGGDGVPEGSDHVRALAFAEVGDAFD
jgi:hypothetical protein